MAVLLDSIKEENCDGVMFSHVACGPLTALQMLEIAEAHLAPIRARSSGYARSFLHEGCR
jgi:hypothetical protein